MDNLKQPKPHRIKLHNGCWIEVVKKRHGVYSVVANNMTVEGSHIVSETSFAFKRWDKQVKDLQSEASDLSDIGLSDKLKWREVVLTPEEIIAPSLKRIKEAVTHVTFSAYCPGDI